MSWEGKMEEKTSQKVKAHIRYKLSNGTIVPGVTTITGMIDKDALIHWAWDLGMKGIDYRSYRDEKAEAGSLAHEMILNYYKAQGTDTDSYSPIVVELAENAFLSFLEWEKDKKVEPILAEAPLVSEKHGFGGTLDLMAIVNGDRTLLDFKTGKGIYRTYWLQVAAYGWLLEENGYLYPARFTILNIPRTEDENFKAETRTGEWIKQHAWPAFKHLLQVYKLLKKVK